MPENERPYIPKDAGAERLVPRGPRLRHIGEVSDIMRSPEEDPLGPETSWRELWRGVQPWQNMQELTDNVRKVLRGFIEKKVPELKRLSPLEDIPDFALLEALAEGRSGLADERVEGQRRQVLLLVAAHVARRIETAMYRNIIERSSDADIAKLGLGSDLRDLLLSVLDASEKSSPLFIRFLAFAHGTPSPPKKASEVGIAVPGRPGTHTIASLFPHETQYIAKRFHAIAERGGAWEELPGGALFKKYAELVARFHEETDIKAADRVQEELADTYTELVASGFPVLVTGPFSGEIQEPYLDPELRVALISPDAEKERTYFEDVREAVALALPALGVGEFASQVRKQPVRIANAIGNFGANLKHAAVAQEDPVVLFLNEQVRTYDRGFPEKVAAIHSKNDEQPFADAERGRGMLERMSRTDTVLHEFCHSVYPSDIKASKRLGEHPEAVIDEIKAETCLRALIPSLVAKKALAGGEDLWAKSTMASSLQELGNRSTKDNPYYDAHAYVLNRLFAERAVSFDGAHAAIEDVGAYWRICEKAARDVLALYQDGQMTEAKAARWIRDNCAPSPDVKRLSDSLRASGPR